MVLATCSIVGSTWCSINKSQSDPKSSTVRWCSINKSQSDPKSSTVDLTEKIIDMLDCTHKDNNRPLYFDEILILCSSHQRAFSLCLFEKMSTILLWSGPSSSMRSGLGTVRGWLTSVEEISYLEIRRPHHNAVRNSRKTAMMWRKKVYQLHFFILIKIDKTHSAQDLVLVLLSQRRRFPQKW